MLSPSSPELKPSWMDSIWIEFEPPEWMCMELLTEVVVMRVTLSPFEDKRLENWRSGFM